MSTISNADFDTTGYPTIRVKLSALRGADAKVFKHIGEFKRYIDTIVDPEKARHIWIGDMGNAIRITPTILAELAKRSLLSQID